MPYPMSKNTFGICCIIKATTKGNNQDRRSVLSSYGYDPFRGYQDGDGLRSYRSSEGRVKEIPYKGKAELVVNDILGGVRSACAYTGATSLKDFSKTARFVRVNRTHNDLSVEKL